MSELIDRDEREARVARALKRLHGKHLRELKKLLGDPPNAENVPDSFWKKVEEDNSELLLLLLMDVYYDAAEQEFPDRVTPDDAEKWATKHARRTARDITRHSVERVRDAWRNFDPEDTESRREFRDNVNATFGQDRADNIAATEVTRAQTDGQQQGVGEENKAREKAADDAAKDAEDEAEDGEQPKETEPAKILVAFWNSMRDAKVCPICRPLHGQPERVWGQVAPDGPPAHVNCRCWLDYREDLRAKGYVPPDLQTK